MTEKEYEYCVRIRDGRGTKQRFEFGRTKDEAVVKALLAFGVITEISAEFSFRSRVKGAKP